MGLISLIRNVAGTTFDSINSQISDQYLEFFTQDSLGQDILVKKERYLSIMYLIKQM